MRRRSIIPFVAVLPFGSFAFAQNWINPAGGSWGNAADWQGDALPTLPVFDLGSTGYTVMLDKSYSTGTVTVQSDTVTLALSGFTLTSPGLNIATGAGQAGSLTLLGPGEFYGTNFVTGGTGEVSGGPLIVNGAVVDEDAGEESGAGFTVKSLLVENGGQIDLPLPGDYSITNGTFNDGQLSGGDISMVLNQLNLSNGSEVSTDGLFATTLDGAMVDDSTIFGGNSLSVSGTIIVQDHGQVDGDGVTLSGTVNVLPTGHFGGYSTLTMTSTGVISVELNSEVEDPTTQPYPGTNGTLDITLQPGFEPMAGEQFDMFSEVSPIGGTFATLNLPALPTGESWDTSDLYTTGVISIVPEPMSFGILSMGLASLALRRRRVRSSN
jgi:hypothetical protein